MGLQSARNPAHCESPRQDHAEVHQPNSTEWPVERSRSISSPNSTIGEARSKATSSALVFALPVISIGCKVFRIISALSPPEQRALAITLTSGASREGTETSTRLVRVALILLLGRDTRRAVLVLASIDFIVVEVCRNRCRIVCENSRERQVCFLSQT